MKLFDRKSRVKANEPAKLQKMTFENKNIVELKVNENPKPFSRSYSAKMTDQIKDYFTKGYAQGSRLLDGVKDHTLMTEDYSIYQVANEMKQKARDSVRNNPTATRALKLLLNNVVGPEGFQFSFLIKNKDGTINHELSEVVQKEFKIWSKSKNCSFDGKDSFLNMQKIAQKDIFTDGEFLFKKIIERANKQNPYGYQLQPIDTARLDSKCNFNDYSNNTYIRMGIEINKNSGRVVNYHLIRRSNLNYDFSQYISTDYEVVPADQVIFDFEKLNAEQTRGITQMHSVLETLDNLKSMNSATIQAVKLAASACMVMEVPQGSTPEDMSTTVNENGDLILEIVPGTIMLTPEGGKVTSHAPQFPESAHASYVKTVKQEIAAALGFSPISLNADTSEANYSVGRILTLEERVTYATAQNTLIEKFLNVVFEDFIEVAMLNNKIKYNGIVLNSFENFGDYEYKFTGRNWEWLDPLKEVDAKRKLFGLGLASISGMLKEEGKDIYAMKKELDLDREVLGEELFMKIFNAVNNIQIPKGSTSTSSSTETTDGQSNGENNPKDAQSND